jgi:ribosome maturation factor RimP
MNFKIMGELNARKKMESWEKFLNEHVKIIYDDYGQHPSKKTGILIGYTDTHLIIKTNNSQQAILLSKILRVEKEGEDGKE